jgi:hypothetical protein
VLNINAKRGQTTSGVLLQQREEQELQHLHVQVFQQELLLLLLQLRQRLVFQWLQHLQLGLPWWLLLVEA